MVLMQSPPVGIQPCPISLFTMASSCGMLVAAKRTYFTSNANLVPTFPNVKVVAFVRNQVAGICNRTAFFWKKRRVTIRFRRVKGGSEKRRAKTLSCPNGQTQQALRLTPQSCCLTAQFGVCYTAMNDNESVRKYLSEIGTKGGRSGKGTKWRKAVCRHAAVIRWRKYREKQRIDELAAQRMEEKTNEQLAVDQRDRDAVDRA